MKALKKTALAALLLTATGTAFAATTTANPPAAATVGNTVSLSGGVINLKGVIVDAPCSISTGSAAQTIDFGQLSKANLESGNRSNSKNVSILLENCDISQKSKVSMTFSGANQNPTYASNEIGTTSNGVVAQLGYAGSTVELNKPTPEQTLLQGDNKIELEAWIQKAAAAKQTKVQTGSFTSAVNFTLNYN